MIDITVGGSLMGKTPEAAYGLLEEQLTSNNFKRSPKRSKPKSIVGVKKLDLESQFTALH